MTDSTKDEYRSKIKELAKKTKISEIYIAKKALELASNENDKTSKKAHIGYYLIDEGINSLYDAKMSTKDKTKAYLLGTAFLTILLAIRNGKFNRA